LRRWNFGVSLKKERSCRPPRNVEIGAAQELHVLLLHGLNKIQQDLTRGDTGGVIIIPNRWRLEFQSATPVTGRFRGPLDVLVGGVLEEDMIRLGKGMNQSLGSIVSIEGNALNFRWDFSHLF
jgi:hypothetical protein